ncbi:hypothetical protein [Burkholderia sp. AU16741]|uniref:hypothetical protein n=1 Tax=Burkholderia sp. AU16741 TaxID=2015347 RepID=UPI00117D1CA3|nr:hypothetical protein [Burkholderia sp. AU16741]
MRDIRGGDPARIDPVAGRRSRVRGAIPVGVRSVVERFSADAGGVRTRATQRIATPADEGRSGASRRRMTKARSVREASFLAYGADRCRCKGAARGKGSVGGNTSASRDLQPSLPDFQAVVISAA